MVQDCGTIGSITKLQVYDSSILAVVGHLDRANRLKDWFKGSKSDFPLRESSDDNDIGDLIVLTADGVETYCDSPTPFKCEDKFAAWGSGVDLALGAMSQGANAVEAVKAAIQFNTGCGMGIDAYDLKTLEHTRYNLQVSYRVQK
jgi:hypothetical protein